MHEAIKTLISHKIPVTSYVAAIQYLNAKEPDGVSPERYEKRIKELIGNEGIQISDKYVRHTYLYLVQETIRSSFTTDQIDMKMLFSDAVKRAVKFVDENEYMLFAEKKTPVKLDSKGEPKKKKGWKKDEAERLYKENKGMAKKDFMALLMDKLDMTKSGSQTYFYNCKKKYGV